LHRATLSLSSVMPTPVRAVAVDPSTVRDGRDHGARVHYRPKEGWIPVVAVVVREDADGGGFIVRLREHTDHIGAEGTLKTARKEDLASAFDVGEDVVVFGDDDGGATVRRGTVRSVDTTVWPPLFVIREGDEARTTFKVAGESCASAARYDAERRRLEEEAAKAVADAAAEALMEEERREREEREKAAASKAAKTAKKKKKKSKEKDGLVGSEGEAEKEREAEKEKEEEAERARVAEEKAAAKAAARARQEEVKAEKAAREKAAKKEAQKARKAAERARREAEEAVVRPKEAREDAGASEEVGTRDDVDVGESVVAEIAEETEPKSASSMVEKLGNVETDAPAHALTAEEQPNETITKTQRRKLEKERRKAQRMAEIDAFLKAHDVAIDADDDDANNGKTPSQAPDGKSKRNKKKKNKNQSSRSDLSNAHLAAKPASGDWFAAFAVLSFFVIASVVYYSYDFIRRKFFAAAFT